MSDIAIRVDRLGKKYRIGKRERYRTLRDTLSETAMAPLRWLRSLGRSTRGADKDGPSEWFWALRDVSFDVPKGAVIGIIGRNGAGKSTLLKVLSRITELTVGRVEIHGRIGSLLEVGTGFHPELTGRENIFLNGAILGMRRQEIVRKFHEIVSFAEIESFIDTPVKHFSSGMYMRLAFAVAAHLEPEILVVDEVLAVGDAQFQRKCLGKMGQVAKEGRTVLFVTHQMNQIRRLCESVIWIDDGHLRQIGDAAEIVSSYERSAGTSTPDTVQPERSARHHRARFASWDIVHPRGPKPNHLATDGPCAIRFVLDVQQTISDAHHAVVLRDTRGDILWSKNTNRLQLTPGVHHLIYRLPSLPLRPGPYSLQVSLGDSSGGIDYWECVPELVIATKPATHSRDEYSGLLNVRSDFELRKCSFMSEQTV